MLFYFCHQILQLYGQIWHLFGQSLSTFQRRESLVLHYDEEATTLLGERYRDRPAHALCMCVLETAPSSESITTKTHMKDRGQCIHKLSKLQEKFSSNRFSLFFYVTFQAFYSHSNDHRLDLNTGRWMLYHTH